MSPRQRGWRIELVPGKDVRPGGGHLAVPLWLLRDGEHRADLALRLSPAEAEVLHAQLCHALDAVTTPDAPCRRPVQTGPSWS